MPDLPDTRNWLAPLLLVALTVAAYANSLTGAFVLDSKVIILEDPRIRQFTFDNISQIFQHSYWWPYTDSNLYRPLTTLSYLFNYAVIGNVTSPFGYHLVNLLVHAGNVLLLYGIARLVCSASVLGSPWPPFFVAAIWAVHPLATEAVTNIVGRADLLAAFGILAALYAHQRHLGYVVSALRHTQGAPSPSRGGFSRTSSRRTSIWLALSLGAATVAMFSKESGVAVIAVIVLYDLLFHARGRPLGELARNWLLFVVPLAVFLLLRSRAMPAALAPDPFVDNPLAAAGFWTSRLTALSVAGRYMLLAIWPARLSSDYSFAQIPLVSGTASDLAACAAVLSVVAIIIWAFLTNRRFTCFSLSFACLTFLPASNLPFLTGTIMAERLFYLPLAGFAAVLVDGVFTIAEHFRLRAVAVAVLSLVIAAGTARTFVRNVDWRDEVTLWASAAKASPRSFKANQGLADAVYESDPSRATLDVVIAASDAAVAILDPLPDEQSVGHVYRRAAGYYVERGDRLRSAGSGQSSSAYQRSVTLIRRYISILEKTGTSGPGTNPATELEQAQVLLANSLSRLGDNRSSIEASKRAQELQPLSPMPYRMLASALVDARDYNAAITWLLTGFIVTGDAEIRQATIDLYQAGGDPLGCAIKTSPNGPTLNQECATVHAHLCAATLQAIQIAKSAGRTDLAEQLEKGALPQYRCSATL